MAEFTKLILTEVGKALLHQVFAEKSLEFTRIELSDHMYEEAELRGLECLEGVRQQNPIRKVITEEEFVTVDFIINNETLEIGYFIRAMGLYARIGGREEVLFAVAVEKSGGCYMPQMSETVTSIQIKLQLCLENTEKVSLVLDTSGLATVGDVLDIQNLVLEERKRAQETEGELREQIEASAFSGSYNDLSNKPVIPTVNNAKLTIQKNGVNVQTFSANQSSDATANIIVPTRVSQLTNDSGYKTTDNKVTQTSVSETDGHYYRVLLSNSADNKTLTEGAQKSDGLLYNPSNNKLSMSGKKAYIHIEGENFQAGVEVKQEFNNEIIRSYMDLDYIGMTREYNGEYFCSEMDSRGIYTSGDLTVKQYKFSTLLEVLANMLFPIIGIDNVAFDKVEFIRHIGYNDSNIYRHYGGNYKSIFVIVQQYTDGKIGRAHV